MFRVKDKSLEAGIISAIAAAHYHLEGCEVILSGFCPDSDVLENNPNPFDNNDSVKKLLTTDFDGLSNIYVYLLNDNSLGIYSINAYVQSNEKKSIYWNTQTAYIVKPTYLSADKSSFNNLLHSVVIGISEQENVQRCVVDYIEEAVFSNQSLNNSIKENKHIF